MYFLLLLYCQDPTTESGGNILRLGLPTSICIINTYARVSARTHSSTYLRQFLTEISFPSDSRFYQINSLKLNIAIHHGDRELVPAQGYQQGRHRYTESSTMKSERLKSERLRHTLGDQLILCWSQERIRELSAADISRVWELHSQKRGWTGLFLWCKPWTKTSTVMLVWGSSLGARHLSTEKGVRAHGKRRMIASKRQR